MRSTERSDEGLLRTYLAQLPEKPFLEAEEESEIAETLRSVRDEFRAGVLSTEFGMTQAVRLLEEVDRGGMSLGEAFDLDLTGRGSRGELRARLAELLAELSAGPDAGRRFAIIESFEIRMSFVVWWFAEILDRDQDPGVAKSLLPLHRKYMELRGRLAGSSLRWVIRLAKTYRGRGVDFGDLIQEGNVGLMRACDKFDPSRGYRFNTYATYWIRQAIGRAIENQATTIRIPSTGHKLARRIRRAVTEHSMACGRIPDLDTLATLCGTCRDEVERLFTIQNAPLSFDSTETDDDSPLSSRISDERSIAPWLQVSETELRARAADLLGLLSARERHVVSERYGIATGEPRSLGSIGEQLGVSRERVRQIQLRALAKMRAAIRSVDYDQ
ncbi:sigma-70 family RNA polymerase sigma factor [Achromobacter marplatensis]|uniref:sigma-70 family RNA polymerase sigma factor n=1 Tax=Achromobacter marplatensis TaxID=470868 RepID=UPI003C78E741